MDPTEKKLALALARKDFEHIDKQMHQLDAEIAKLEKRRRLLESERIQADARIRALESED